jgi:hypothetical protein
MSYLYLRRISEISTPTIKILLRIFKASVVVIALTASSLQAALVTYPAPKDYPSNSTYSV